MASTMASELTAVEQPTTTAEATSAPAGESTPAAAATTTESTAESAPAAAVAADKPQDGTTLVETVKDEIKGDKETKETVVEAVPVTEGTLGYKAPGLIKCVGYVSLYIWS